MASFGQSEFGQGLVGGHESLDLTFVNRESVDANQPILVFGANNPDVNDRLWFSVQLAYGAAVSKDYDPVLGPWDPPPPIAVMTEGGQVELDITEPGFTPLDPNRWYSIILGTTPDPLLADWWVYRTFTFQAVADPASIGPIEQFFLYETDNRVVGVPEFATCTTHSPYAEWLAKAPYDYYAWNCTIDSANQVLPNRVYQPHINFTDTGYPLYNGTWYLKVAKVYGGAVGPILTFQFEVQAGSIIVS